LKAFLFILIVAGPAVLLEPTSRGSASLEAFSAVSPSSKEPLVLVKIKYYFRKNT
jgi:hypothetical protein